MKKTYFYSFVIAVAGILITSEMVYSGIPARPPMTVPTLGEWGMIGTAIILGIAGLYKILKSK
ncbi:MAG: IPTL-CTERM sorting domain-containing protein [Nitrospiraceae bacterium]|nr:MAG: IPTL-CTERM sorting domain-containing protein [Nitrospiraceae bacterium]